MTDSPHNGDGVQIVWDPSPGEIPGARVLRFGVVLTPGEPQRVRADIAARVLEAYSQVRRLEAPPVVVDSPPVVEDTVEPHDELPLAPSAPEPVPDLSEPTRDE